VGAYLFGGPTESGKLLTCSRLIGSNNLVQVVHLSGFMAWHGMHEERKVHETM